MSEASFPSNQNNLSEREVSVGNEGNLPQLKSEKPQTENDGERAKRGQKKPSREFLANTDWYAIACKIRHSNRQLVKQNENLTNSIRECEQKIAAQERRYRSIDNLVNKQTSELNQSQAEIKKLQAQLESQGQQQQNQQILVESLKEQLKASQEQVARLERECSLLQDNYNQQQRQLIQSEKQNRELQIRLQRQQRYTLQFKTALEQSLDSSSGQLAQGFHDSSELKVSKIEPWSVSQSEKDANQDSGGLPKKLLAVNKLEELNNETGESEQENLTPESENLPVEAEKIADNTSGILPGEGQQQQETPEGNPPQNPEKMSIGRPFWQIAPHNSGKSPLKPPEPSQKQDDTEEGKIENKKKRKRFLQLPKIPNDNGE